MLSEAEINDKLGSLQKKFNEETAEKQEKQKMNELAAQAAWDRLMLLTNRIAKIIDTAQQLQDMKIDIPDYLHKFSKKAPALQGAEMNCC